MSKWTLDYSTYYDRVYAGWLGKSLGGVVGAPFECHKQFNHVPQEKLWPDKLWPNDDLDIQVVYLEALQELGLDFNSSELAEFWQQRCFYVCCEYGVFINNLEHGIYPPISGRWNNDWFQSSEGCPIRSEIWGFIAPGNPALAIHYARQDGCLDHTEISIEIEQFLSAAAALAFFENSVESLLEKTCLFFPADNQGVRIYRAVKNICARHPEPYDAWLQIIRQFGHRDSTRAVINNAFAFMGLILGHDDFKETMRLCIQAGWDCDCTAATTGALLGTLFGTAALPTDWLEKLGKTLVCAVEIKHQFQPFTEFAKETCDIGLEMAQVKNRDLEIINAPEVAVRSARRPQVLLTATYPDKPELPHERCASVKLIINNATSISQKGVLDLSVPEGLDYSPMNIPLSLEAGKIAEVELQINKKPDFVMHDKNLMQAVFGNSVLKFGLAGTKRLLIYGPYWDMWDKEKFSECPYQNARLTCNPGNLPDFASDAMNTHVRFDFPYLDEERLLNESLASERPALLESAAHTFSKDDLGKFIGSSCWYVETTICSEKTRDITLSAGANCPFKCWFDGQLLFSRNEHTNATMKSVSIHVSEKPQRLVLKLVTHLDDFHFHFSFRQSNETRKRAISPFYSDLEYL
ncbi:MAG: ADP-ribosylglycohydrolase family protein [Lentisphaeria bacterium]